MTKERIERVSLIAAGVVIVALTALAFWLSYAHLAEVAGDHGLAVSGARQWAWPATLDAFIVAGELLMLRAGLQRRTDHWAVGITAAGSLGSIALNVAGVTGARDAATVPLLDYVVAAVPPTAALLAFGVLMRQIHTLVESTPVAVLDTEPPVVATTVDTAPVEVSPPPALDPAPVEASSLVICGGHLEIPAVPPRPRLGTEAARAAIEQAWRDGLSIREAARVSTRAPSQVQRVYATLDADRGPAPIQGQTELDVIAA
ncbi:DUF2637 domain-containing protein [Streptomyces sp. NPDC002138]|uniref:DUF2637 domain-containing protein n=1 Tax=Streptomyces sp. NPDC002138 TaxID=3154410 RepID=UPI0033207270